MDQAASVRSLVPVIGRPITSRSAPAAMAARAVAELEPAFLTVHASGGAAMIEAAAQALPGTRIVAVTVLTSMDEAALESIGMAGPDGQHGQAHRGLDRGAGARAIVCSPLELSLIHI